MYSYENGYWGITARKHQKMRPSKRRKLNKEMKYDTTFILEPICDIKITSVGVVVKEIVDDEIKTNIFLC